MSLGARVLDVGPRDLLSGVGLLLLRFVAGGLMIVQHGWEKLSNFANKSDTFPDPLGVGSEASLALACVGEVAAPVLLVAGLGTRPAALVAGFAMGVAAFVHHAGDPLGKRELALVYLAMFAALALVGPGRFSLDRRLGG